MDGLAHTVNSDLGFDPLDYRIVRHGSGEESVWKNGQGRSWSIGNSRSFTGHDHDWSVSIALVEGECEFSLYPGIDRTLGIIQGDGMQIRLGDREILLTQDSEPFSFDGEAKVFGDILHGRHVMDFNVLTLRSSCTHSSKRIRLVDEFIPASDSDVLIAHVHSSAAVIRVKGLNEELQQGDMLYALRRRSINARPRLGQIDRLPPPTQGGGSRSASPGGGRRKLSG